MDNSKSTNNRSRCSKCGRLTGPKRHICPDSGWNKGLKGFGAGRKASEETKAKMRASASRYWKGKIGARRGQTHSEETKAKMRKPKSEAHKAKMRGRKRTDQHNKNWVEARKRNGSFVHSKEWALEQSGRMKGEHNPNWQGGLSFREYPAEWTDELKQQIRTRDGHVCQMCGSPPKKGINLDVHHIDYIKTNCASENLITLCDSCHMKTNFNRDEWLVYFRERAA